MRVSYRTQSADTALNKDENLNLEPSPILLKCAKEAVTVFSFLFTAGTQQLRGIQVASLQFSKSESEKSNFYMCCSIRRVKSRVQTEHLMKKRHFILPMGSSISQHVLSKTLDIIIKLAPLDGTESICWEILPAQIQTQGWKSNFIQHCDCSFLGKKGKNGQTFNSLV